MQGLSAIKSPLELSLVKGPPHTEQATRNNTWVSEVHFSGDELIGKDNFHFPIPNTTISIPQPTTGP